MEILAFAEVQYRNSIQLQTTYVRVAIPCMEIGNDVATPNLHL